MNFLKKRSKNIGDRLEVLKEKPKKDKKITRKQAEEVCAAVKGIKIDELWAGFIHDFNFNIPMKRLDFTVKTYDVDRERSFDITISGISFFLFYDDYAHRHQLYEWKKTELSIFFYEPSNLEYPNPFIHEYGKGRVYDIDFNLTIQLWSSKLTIKAKRLQINNKAFALE